MFYQSVITLTQSTMNSSCAQHLPRMGVYPQPFVWLVLFYNPADVHLIRRHCWVGDHHTLHRSSRLVAHDALTLSLLHSHQALEPLLTRQDGLVTCKGKPSFELVVPGQTQVIFGGVGAFVYKPTFRHLNFHIRKLSKCLFYKNAFFWGEGRGSKRDKRMASKVD